VARANAIPIRLSGALHVAGLDFPPDPHSYLHTGPRIVAENSDTVSLLLPVPKAWLRKNRAFIAALLDSLEG
jgi:hypothetical protein